MSSSKQAKNATASSGQRGDLAPDSHGGDRVPANADQPVRLRLVNLQGQPAIGMETGPPEPLVLEISNETANDLHFQTPIDDRTCTVTLEFRHGVLSDASREMLAGADVAENLLHQTDHRDRPWQVQDIAPDDPGVAVKIGLLATGLPALRPNETLRVPLHGITATAEGGARLTRVRLAHDLLGFRDSHAPFSGETIPLVQVSAPRFASPVPLRAYLASGPRISATRERNAVIFALEHRTGGPIRGEGDVAPAVGVRFCFGDAPWALCAEEEVSRISVFQVSNGLAGERAFARIDPDVPGMARAEVPVDVTGDGESTHRILLALDNIPARQPGDRYPAVDQTLERMLDRDVPTPIPVSLTFDRIEGAGRGSIDLDLQHEPPEANAINELRRKLAELRTELRQLGTQDPEASDPPKTDPEASDPPKTIETEPRDIVSGRKLLDLPRGPAWSPVDPLEAPPNMRWWVTLGPTPPLPNPRPLYESALENFHPYVNIQADETPDGRFYHVRLSFGGLLRVNLWANEVGQIADSMHHDQLIIRYKSDHHFIIQISPPLVISLPIDLTGYSVANKRCRITGRYWPTSGALEDSPPYVLRDFENLRSSLSERYRLTVDIGTTESGHLNLSFDPEDFNQLRLLSAEFSERFVFLDEIEDLTLPYVPKFVQRSRDADG